MKRRTKYIWDKVQAHYDRLCELGYEVVFTALQGSQNYGLDEYSEEYWSDVDTKSIVLPKFDDFAAAKQPISKVVEIEDELGRLTHAEVKDVRVMFEMFLKENISYIELLYSKFIIINPKYKGWVDKLLDNRDAVAAYNVKAFAKCVLGMAKEKQKALCHPFPAVLDKIEKFGYDGKQLSHAGRLEIFLNRMIYCGVPFKRCYNVPDGKAGILMNCKKQLDGNDEVLSKERAVRLMDNIIESIEEDVGIIVASPKYGVNEGAADFLKQMKVDILKTYFLEQLSGYKGYGNGEGIRVFER